MSSAAPKLIILESVDSTNNYAMAMTQKGVANSGEAVFAREQTSGKGRRGKAWKSANGENILLTVLAQMQWLPVQQQFRLSVAVALACRDFFSKYINVYLLFIIAFLLAFVAAYLSWHLVENPFLKLKAQLKKIGFLQRKKQLKMDIT